MKEKLIITIIILLYSIYINAKAQNVYPVEGANWNNITSTFGPRLLSEGYDTHRGLDVKGFTSEKVVSIADGGRVIVAESDFCIIEYLSSENPKNIPYALRYYHLDGNNTLNKDDIVYKGKELGKYSISAGHIDMKYYPKFESSRYQHWRYPENAKHPLVLLPYSEKDDNGQIISKIEYRTDDNPSAPSGQYIQIIVKDWDADMNSLTLFLDDSHSYLSENDLIMGDYQPYNEINYQMRINYGEYGHSYSTKDPTDGSNFTIHNGAIKIIPQAWGGASSGDIKTTEFRFYLDDYKINEISGTLVASAKVFDINGKFSGLASIDVTPTCIDCGGGDQPAPPTGLMASVDQSDMSVNLVWDYTGGADQYVIYRREIDETQSDDQIIGISGKTSFKDTYRTKPGTQYYYRIAGVNTAIEDGEGGNSSEVNAIMPSQGTVKSKRLWLDANLTGDVTVTDSTVLQIQKGSTVELANNCKIKIESGSRLIAHGTDFEPIKFIRANSTEEWNKIVLRSSAGNSFKWCLFDGGNKLVEIKGKNNKFEHCIFRNGWRGVSSGSNVDGAGRSEATITNCLVENNSTVGIVAYFADMSISQTTIRDNEQAGVWAYSAKVDPFHHNIVKYNGSTSRDGIEVNSTATLYMREGPWEKGYNNVHDNGYHQISTSGDLLIGHRYDDGGGTYNAIHGDTSGSRYLVDNNSGTYVSAHENWWGQPIPDQIEMFDGTVHTEFALDHDPWDGEGAGGDVPSQANPTGKEQMLSEASDDPGTGPWDAVWEQTRQTFEQKGDDELLHRLYQVAGLAEGTDLPGRFNSIVASISSGSNADLAPSLRTDASLRRKAGLYHMKSLARQARYERAGAIMEGLDSSKLSRYEKRDYLQLKLAVELQSGNVEAARQALGSFYRFQEQRGHDLEELRARYSVIEQELETEGRLAPKQQNSEVLGSATTDSTVKIRTHPNPFNPTTTFTVQLQQERQVSLKVYNSLGREVATLHNGRLSAGEYRMRFNATGLASGLYIYRLDTGAKVVTNTITLLK